jgi:hypothetical protein
MTMDTWGTMLVLKQELGLRVASAMITENYAPKKYQQMNIIRDRAAEAHGLCDICHDHKAGSGWDPKLCSGCGFAAHAEGYI